MYKKILLSPAGAAQEAFSQPFAQRGRRCLGLTLASRGRCVVVALRSDFRRVRERGQHRRVVSRVRSALRLRRPPAASRGHWCARSWSLRLRAATAAAAAVAAAAAAQQAGNRPPHVESFRRCLLRRRRIRATVVLAGSAGCGRRAGSASLPEGLVPSRPAPQRQRSLLRLRKPCAPPRPPRRRRSAAVAQSTAPQAGGQAGRV